MNTANKTQVILMIIMSSLLLTACGGGGGDSSTGSSAPVVPTPPPTPAPTTPPVAVITEPLKLSQDNYIDYSVLFNKSLHDEAQNIRSAYHQPSNDTNRLAQLLWLSPPAAKNIHSQLLSTMASTAGTSSCSQGGSMIRTLNDSNSDGIISAVGEYQDISFNNCNNGNIVANGSMRYTIAATNNPGTISPTTMELTLSYSNLTAKQSDITDSVNGSKKISIDTTNGLSLNNQIPNELTTQAQSSTASTKTTQSNSYQTHYTENGIEWQIRLAGAMSLILDQKKEATVNFTTNVPLTGSMSNGSYSAPRTGNYLTQWNNQTLNTSSNADGLITTQADLDTNGSYELSYSRNWDTLTIPNN